MDDDDNFDYGHHWARGSEPYDPTLQNYIRKCLPGEPTYDLCKICRTIDFNAIRDTDSATVPIGYTVLPYDEKTIAPVFLFPEGLQWLDLSCPFCCLMDPYMRAWQDAIPELHLSSWGLSFYKILEERWDVIGLVFVGSGSPYSPKFYAVKNEVVLFPVAPTVGKDCALPSQRRLNDKWLKKELEMCQSLHAHETPGTAIPGMMLLNCATMEVVPAPDNAEYLALSYVWSKPSAQPSASSTQKIAVAVVVPPTIRDAAKLTLRLGKQFLWVDRLCIDQHNPDHLRQQIASMADIYRNAFATIVNLDGDDATPLPGVSKCFTDNRLTRVRAGIVAARGISPEVIDSSTWSNRGWTFQEAYLSTRIIYISGSGIILSCREQVLEELPPEVDLATNARISWVFRSDDDREEASLFVGAAYPWNDTLKAPHSALYRWNETGRRFVTAFEVFTRRSLTYESDALDAFRGYLGSCGFWSYQGIPVMDLDHKLILERLDTPPCPFPSDSARGFCFGLSWRRDPLAAKRGYETIQHRGTRWKLWPSWSWVSARRGARYLALPISPLESTVLSRISMMTDEGMASLEEFFGRQGPPRVIPEQSPYLQIEAVLLLTTSTASRHGKHSSHGVEIPSLATSRVLEWFLHDGFSDHDDSEVREGRATYALLLYASPSKWTGMYVEERLFEPYYEVFWLEVFECGGCWRRSGLITSYVAVRSAPAGHGPQSTEHNPNSESSISSHQEDETISGTPYEAGMEVLLQDLSRLPTRSIVLG